MTSRDRLLTVLKGEIPDCVPAAPDTSNMIPAKMTGLPFWDVYLFNKIPIWSAYINCAKYFDFDSLMDGYIDVRFDDLGEIDRDWKEYIVFRDDYQIVTRMMRKRHTHEEWGRTVNAYYIDNPPTHNLPLNRFGLPEIPSHYECVEKENEPLEGAALLKEAKAQMGNQGLVGVSCGRSSLIGNDEEVYDYYDNPQKYEDMRDRLIDRFTARFHKLMSLPADSRPDFICTGCSGSLIFQTPHMFETLALPIVKHVTALCKQHGIPSHIHSCGPEAKLIEYCYKHTDLTVVDPLEIPPMGDCNLKELKKLYGDKLVLKGNLHTTDVMLRGTTEDVIKASKQAIDDGAAGGRFILSTGDQCGRDTPHENLFALIETARTYGKYR